MPLRQADAHDRRSTVVKACDKLAGGRPKSADLRKDPASLAGEAEGKIRLEGVPRTKADCFCRAGEGVWHKWLVYA
jgi:hypothetical protein